MYKNNNIIMRKVIVVISFITIIVILAAVLISENSNESIVVRKENTSILLKEDDSSIADIVYLNDKAYVKKNNITSLLFLGIDKNNLEQMENNIGSGGRSDVIILLILDDTNKTIQVLDISRDTMIDISVYSTSDEFLYTTEKQIALQYACGISHKRSCWLTKNKVMELLYGIHIDGVMSFSMKGIQPLVDYMDGVDVVMSDDYTYIDKSLKKGEEVTLYGDLSEKFLRYRDITEFGSNNTRMKRQIDFIKSFFNKMHQVQDSKVLAKIRAVAKPYIESELSIDNMDKLLKYSLNEGVLMLPGENVQGEFHDEYYVDDNALKQLVIDLFYEAN